MSTDTELFSIQAPELVSPDKGIEASHPLGPLLLDTTGYEGRFVVVHSLTTLADVNPNRDFDGVPKRTTYGGVPRLRISSQARLRAGRVWSREFLTPDVQAARTRSLPGVVRKLLTDTYGHDPAEAGWTAAALIASTGMGVDWARPDLTTAVMFVSTNAAEQLAELAHSEWDTLAEAREKAREVIDAAVSAASAKGKGRKPKKAETSKKPDTAEDVVDQIYSFPEAEAAAKDAETPAAAATDAEIADATTKDEDDKPKFKANLVPNTVIKRALATYDPATSIDIALYGRMLANIKGGSVKSAVQVAHSLSVDPLAELAEDYTVVDDWQNDDVFGAANIGRQYLASGTLYGFAALDRGKLRSTLAPGHSDPDAIARFAEQVFVAAMAWSMPDGKRTRSGSTVAPTLLITGTTDFPPLSAAPAFETPIDVPAGVASSYRLCEYLDRVSRRFRMIGGVGSWISPDGTEPPLLPTPLAWD